MGVDSDYINVLSEDSAGNILVGTDNGIVIYDYVLDDFRRPSGYELLDDRVYDIAQDSEGALWIGSRSQGLFRYDPAADRISRVPVKKDDEEEKKTEKKDWEKNSAPYPVCLSSRWGSSLTYGTVMETDMRHSGFFPTSVQQNSSEKRLFLFPEQSLCSICRLPS